MNIEFSNWLMFQQTEKEYPYRNIILKENYEFHITTIDYSEEGDRVAIELAIPKNYKALLDEIREDEQKHAARVVIMDYGVRRRMLWVRGEIRLTIPLDFYYRHMARFKGDYGKLYGGVDINTNRNQPCSSRRKQKTQGC